MKHLLFNHPGAIGVVLGLGVSAAIIAVAAL